MPRVEPTPAELADADTVVLLTDHDAFDLDEIRKHAKSLRLPPPPVRRERRESLSTPMRVICVAGARPNYMKVKPVMDALEQCAAEVILVHTGQHYDAAMNDVFFADLGIRQPDYFLRAGRAAMPPRRPG